jgi:septin family protein
MHESQSLLTDPTNPHSPFDPELVAQAAANAHVEQGIQIKPHNVELEEEGVRISLTIVDTPGFGDGVDNEYWWVGCAAPHSAKEAVVADDAASRRSRPTLNASTMIS